MVGRVICYTGMWMKHTQSILLIVAEKVNATIWPLSKNTKLDFFSASSRVIWTSRLLSAKFVGVYKIEYLLFVDCTKVVFGNFAPP